MLNNPVQEHRTATLALAESLKGIDVYHWLVEYGYFPESYVLPPCFRVVERPKRGKKFFAVTGNGKKYNIPTHELVGVHFPKSEFTDRDFGVMHPHLHNDIAYHIARNWKQIVKALVPSDCIVTSYSFPVPIDSKHPGRLGHLRSGRMIYEFIGMIDKDLASTAYRYKHLVRVPRQPFRVRHGERRSELTQELDCASRLRS